MPRRRRSAGRPLLILLVLLLAIPALGGLAVYIFVDPNALKPRIEAAVRAATGRDLVIAGPVHIGLALRPVLQASDVRLSNPPGFSRPDMIRLARVQARLSLWPLLLGRIEIASLSLSEPDVLFETNKAGIGNWHFGAPAPAPAVANGAANAVAAPAEATHPRPGFDLAALQVTGGRIAWPGHVVAIRSLQATSAATISATADVAVAGHDVALSAELGSLQRLLSSDATTPAWPVQLVARGEGARLAVAGTVDRPLEGRGYQLALDATLPDLAAFGQLFAQHLPPLHDIAASARVSDAGDAPALSALMIRAGRSGLETLFPGLALDGLQVSANGSDDPLKAVLDADIAAGRLHLEATLGTLSALLRMASAEGNPAAVPAALPVDLSAELAGARITAKGSVARPLQLAGLDLALAARVPDLATLSALAGRPLPALKDLTFAASVTDGKAGSGRSVTLKAATLSGPFGDLAGDITLGGSPLLSATGELSGKRIDLDRLQSALAAMPSAASSVPSPPPPSAAMPAVPTAASAASGPRHLIPDRPFDLAALKSIDSDMRFSFGEIMSGGIVYRDLAAHLVVAQGRLALDPFAATLPGGKLDGRLTVDANAAEPPVTLALNAPGLALKPLLTAFGLPDDATGTVELAVDVTAAGHSPHALAASLAGRIGVAVTDGEIDNRLLGATIGVVLHATRLPSGLLFGGGGRTKLRCAVARADALQGVVTLSSLVVDANRALVQGAGVIDLANETLGLRLRPLLRTGGPGVVVPVRVVGPLGAPKVEVDGGGALVGVAGGLVGRFAGRNPLAAVAGLLGAERGGDACGPAVVAARGVRPVIR